MVSLSLFRWYVVVLLSSIFCLIALMEKFLCEKRQRCCFCIIFVNLRFYFSIPIGVGALYVRKYFNEESKKAAVDLVNSIREEYIKILKEVSWMDEVTREAAIEKAKSMTSHIAYPDELTDNNKLEEYYDGLELDPETLLQNVLRIRTFKDNHLIKKLRQSVNKTDWETHTMPATVNAAYSPLENSIRKYSWPFCDMLITLLYYEC